MEKSVWGTRVHGESFPEVSGVEELDPPGVLGRSMGVNGWKSVSNTDSNW